MGLDQEHYNVFFRKTRRHKWQYQKSYWATPIKGLEELRSSLQERLSKIPQEQGSTPGYAIVRNPSAIVLMSMSKATWQRIPHNDKAIVEPRD